MNIHSSSDDFQMRGYVALVGIVRTIYNPILLEQIKFNKKLSMCAVSIEKISLAGMSSRTKSKMPPHFCCD